MVVNVTEPTHVLFHGFVIRRAYRNEQGKVIIDNYGEGTSAKQAGYVASDFLINRVWLPATESCVNAVMRSLNPSLQEDVEYEYNRIEY